MRCAIIAIVLLRSCVATAQPWPMHVLARQYPGADGIDLYDVDGDGWDDLAVSWEGDSSAGRALTVTRGGRPFSEWGSPTVRVEHVPASVHGYEDVRVDDLDGDGAPDYLGAAEGEGEGVFVLLSSTGVLEQLATQEPRSWQMVTTWDVDGDGSPDIVAAGQGRLAWWRPDSSAPGQWVQREIARPVRSLWAVPDDVDGDGITDVLYADRSGPEPGIWWARNPGDGSEPWAATRLYGEAVTIACMHDMDGDGDDDVIAPLADGGLAWVERGPWAAHVLSPPWGGVPDVVSKGCAVGDLDDDGDADLVVTVRSQSVTALPHVVWAWWGMADWEHLDPPATLRKTDEPVLVDCDGDDDLDVAVTDEGKNVNIWGYGLVCLEQP